MWEVFKILLLCLISVFLATLTASFLYVCALFFIIVIVFYDFDFTVGLERHAINKFRNSYLKVRNYYLAFSQSEQNTNSYLYTPTMNSINKQTSSFELSRFNKSGNALSPITNSANNTALTSRRLVQSRQTSTPLTKTSPWQKNSIQSATNSLNSPHYHPSVNRSPRYSLSSVNINPKSENNESPKPTIQTVTGPLLASTRFNINLGTYMDIKSPGLASRVVQYNNELSGEQSSTHQAKYGSPGQFPIVQLYKKELPILTRTPRRCTVRIAPPDPVSYNSDQANTILRDSFVQNNIDNAAKIGQTDTEINTRSVLEALKEISRKRIHTNDDLEDISKRQRKNSLNSPNNLDQLNKDGKRMREDTPPKPKDSSTTTAVVNSAPKRICVVNEIESSLSSSRLMRLQQGQKRKSSLNISENNKQRRISNGELVSRETQTIITNGVKPTPVSTPSNIKISTAAQTETEKPETPLTNVQSILESARRKKHNSDRRTIEDIDEENSTLQFKDINRKPSTPFFSEAPLKILKKNKFEVMLSAMSGKKPELIPLPIVTLTSLKKKAEQDKIDGAENKEVTSILSPKNKMKHDKHVTFALPTNDTDSKSTTESSSEVNKSETTQFPSMTSLPESQPNAPSSFQTSSAPNISTNFSNPQTNFNFNSTGSSTNLQPTSNISFGAVTTTTVSTNIITSSVENKEKSSENSLPTFGTSAGFKPPENKSINTPSFGGLAPPTMTEKLETNKIDLKSPQASTATIPATNTVSSLTLPASKPSMFGTGTATSTLQIPSSNTTVQPSMPFTINKPAFNVSETSSSITPNFGSSTNQQQASNAPNSTSSLFNFGTKTDNKISTTPSSSFNLATTTAASNQVQPKPGGFKFDLGKTSTPVSSKIESSKTSAFVNSTTSSTFSFGSSNTTTSSVPTFTAVKTTSVGFGITNTTSSTPAFGTSNSNNDAFGSANTLATTTTFGTPSTTSTPGVFGALSSTSSKTNMFGTNSSPASSGIFGAPATTATTGTFGNANTTTNNTFGASATSTTAGVFGAPTTSATTGVFGAPTTTTTTGIFGAPTTTSTTTGVFGTPTTNTTTGVFGAPNNNASGVFGASSTGFGPAKTENPPAFGTFGNTNTSGFKPFSTPTTTQNSSGFGVFGTPTTTQTNTFGNTAPTTTSAFTFSANKTKEFSFGSTPAVTTTTAPAMFGSATPTTTSNLFGTPSSGFGTTTAAVINAFGTTTTTTAAPSTFGQSTTGVFGTPSSSNFGNNATGSVFGGANNNNTNTFGSSTSGVFGTTNQPSSTFGANTTNVFGTSNTNQGGNGVFGAPNTNANNTFGANTNNAFASRFTNNNNSNSAPPPSFNAFGSPATQTATTQPSSVFAFGSSSQQASSTAPSGSNAFQFGAAGQAPKPAGFNFSASNPTPNINFGPSTTPAFNAPPSPAFGNPPQSGFNNPAPNTGMFNIGSGSTAAKQRPMIKARRRN